MKIHIIGGSGSGKSYLAKKLAKELYIPYYDLDNIFWDNSKDSYGNKNDEETRNNQSLL